MPIEVVEIDDSKSFQEAKGTESLPGFDKLPQIEDQQLNQSPGHQYPLKNKNVLDLKERV